MTRKIDLNKEEKDILRSFEKGEWVSSMSSERAEELKSYAKATVRKNKKVNFRISTVDLSQLQTRALKEGIPYQTLIASVIHKFVNGDFDSA